MGGGLTGWVMASSTLAHMEGQLGDAVVTPVVSVEEEDLMEVQFESQEPVVTPMEQDVPFDHTYCTESACYGEAEPFPTMTAHETSVYFESYLGLNGLVLSDTSTMDTSDSDYVSGGSRSFQRQCARLHAITGGLRVCIMSRETRTRCQD
jgi:hypothetical protein